MANERMSSVDTAWLRMDRPTNLMMITGVMIFEDKLNFAQLMSSVETRFLSYRRFKQRVVKTFGVSYWETDPYFDVSSHVRLTALPGAAGKEELQALVSDLLSTPLDASKPLWQFHLVEGYRGGSALIARIHHCYADGIALIQVLLSMTEATSDASRAAERHARDGDDDVMPACSPLGGAVDCAIRLPKALLKEVRTVVRNPLKVMDYAREGVDGVTEAVGVILMSDDPQTRFKGKLGVRKRVAWSEPLSLDEIKAVGKLFDCSVNDVLLSSVAGALRTYLLGLGQSVADLEIRAAVPINLRPPDKQIKSLGNQFGLVMLTLPLGIANPLERLYRVRQYMQELKNSYQAQVIYGLLGIFGMGAAMLQTPALDLLSRRVTLVMTNVPGPQRQLYLTGAKLSQPMFWVPQTGNVGVGVSILSYNGQVQLGLATDNHLVADPETISRRFGAEFEKLVLIAMMQPWDQAIDANEVF